MDYSQVTPTHAILAKQVFNGKNQQGDPSFSALYRRGYGFRRKGLTRMCLTWFQCYPIHMALYDLPAGYLPSKYAMTMIRSEELQAVNMTWDL